MAPREATHSFPDHFITVDYDHAPMLPGGQHGDFPGGVGGMTFNDGTGGFGDVGGGVTMADLAEDGVVVPGGDGDDGTFHGGGIGGVAGMGDMGNSDGLLLDGEEGDGEGNAIHAMMEQGGSSAAESGEDGMTQQPMDGAASGSPGEGMNGGNNGIPTSMMAGEVKC